MVYMRLQIAVIATLLTLLIATDIAHGASAIDIGIPSSYSLSSQAQAIDNGSNAVGVSGSVKIVHSGGNTYVSVQTLAADNTSLSYLNEIPAAYCIGTIPCTCPYAMVGNWPAIWYSLPIT